MDAGDWLELATFGGGGLLFYVLINRLGAGRLWIPNLPGRLRHLSTAGLVLSLIGMIGLLVALGARTPRRIDADGAFPDSFDRTRDVAAIWFVLPIAGLVVGAVLLVAAIVVGRRRTPTGNPVAQRHRGRA